MVKTKFRYGGTEWSDLSKRLGVPTEANADGTIDCGGIKVNAEAKKGFGIGWPRYGVDGAKLVYCYLKIFGLAFVVSFEREVRQWYQWERGFPSVFPFLVRI